MVAADTAAASAVAAFPYIPTPGIISNLFPINLPSFPNLPALPKPIIVVPTINPSLTYTTIVKPTIELPPLPKPTIIFPGQPPVTVTKPTITIPPFINTITIPLLKPNIGLATITKPFTFGLTTNLFNSLPFISAFSNTDDSTPAATNTATSIIAPTPPHDAPSPIPLPFTNNCEPVTCNTAGVRIPNPRNCNRYYKCVSQGGVLVPRSFICPSTVPVFSPTLQLCVRGVKCRVRCEEEEEEAVTSSVGAQNGDNSSQNSGVSSAASQQDGDTTSTTSTTTTTPTTTSTTTTTPTTTTTSTTTTPSTTTTTTTTTTTASPTTTDSTTQSPSPTCLITCTEPNAKVPDPRNCRFFYICHFREDSQPDPVRVKCPSSRPTFDSIAGECVKRAACISRCPSFATVVVSQNHTTNLTSQDDITTTTAVVTSITNTPAISPSAPSSVDCQPVCLVPDSWLADPADCRYFYVCHFLRDVIPEPRRIRCPPNRPVFDQTLGRCSAGGACKVSCNESSPITTPDITPEPSCHPKCLIPNTRVPDPSDCKHYYVCMLMGTLTPQPIRSRCPDATPFFDSSKNECVEKTECKLACPLIDVTAPATLEDSELAGDSCSPRCVEPQSIVRDPSDCHHYYMCDGSPLTPTRMKCPSHQPYFDSTITSCSEVNTCNNICGQNSTTTTTIVSPNTVTLHPDNAAITTTVRPGLCRPRCSAHNTIVHDPLDCHHYYVCMVVEGKHHLSRVKCPEDRPVFDLPSYSCQRDAPCILTCADNIITHPSDTDAATVTTTPSNIPVESSSSVQDPSVTPDSSNVVCEPEKCPKAGILLADLSDCHRYYACVYVDSLVPRPVHATCPESIPIFHFGKKRCVAETECYQPCFNHTVPVTLPSTNTPAHSDQPITTDTNNNSPGTVDDALNSNPLIDEAVVVGEVCAPQCEEAGGLAADPKDCRFYYTCSGLHRSQDPVRIQCPFDKPLFDHVRLQCSGKAACVVTCPSSNTEVEEGHGYPDVNTCTHAGYFTKSHHTCLPLYTHCYHKADRLVKATKTCPPGLVFNPVSNYPYCVPPQDCPYDPAVQGPSINTTTCRHPGSFPRCRNCCSDFLRCEASGDEYRPVATQCPGGLVFNTDPRYPVCVRPQDCSHSAAASDRCDTEGYYPACRGCCKDYNYCTGDGLLLHRSCPHPLLFNPDSSQCVLPWKCPQISQPRPPLP